MGIKVAQFSEKRKMCLSQLRPGSMTEYGRKEKSELGIDLPRSTCAQILSVPEVSMGSVWVVSKCGLAGLLLGSRGKNSKFKSTYFSNPRTMI